MLIRDMSKPYTMSSICSWCGKEITVTLPAGVSVVEYTFCDDECVKKWEEYNANL